MARQLTDGVWLLEVGLVDPVDSNAYLVVDDGDEGEESGAQPPADPVLTLVDTGLFLNRPTLTAEIRAAGYDPADVGRVLLTHYDLDHVGGLRELDGFDGPVYLGQADADLLAGESDPTLSHPKGLFHRAVRPFWSMDDVDLQRVGDGDEIGGFTAYHTPGHNPGHTVYHHPGRGVVFLGDLVWEEDGELTTPFWGDSYDMAQLGDSVRALSERLPEFDVAAMGHGQPLTRDGKAALTALANRL